jgi:hypothetical protein
MATRRDPLELMVELDRDCDPISGRVVDAGGRVRTFAGWLELMEMLDGPRDRVDGGRADEGRTS